MRTKLAVGAFSSLLAALPACNAFGPSFGGADAGGGDSVEDREDPQAAVTGPAAGAVLEVGEQTIVVEASDDVGVSRVQIYIDDSLAGAASRVAGSESSGTWEYVWNAEAGPHRIDAVAQDAIGKSGDDTVEVQVGDGDAAGRCEDAEGDTLESIAFEKLADVPSTTDFPEENWDDPVPSSSLTPVPIDLGLYAHVPSGLAADGSYPLVVVLHGCWEDATIHSQNTEWNQLADRFNFLVLYPENAAHGNECFDWHSQASQSGESDTDAAAVLEMIEEMRSRYPIDEDRIYVTGMSAGAAISVVLLALEPDLFAAGAIHAGVPFAGYSGKGDGSLGYLLPPETRDQLTSDPEDGWMWQVAFSGAPPVDRDPSAWAERMPAERAYPPLLAFHGTEDPTVNPAHARELVEQWTAVQGADQAPDHEGALKPDHDGHSYAEHHGPEGELLIATVTMDGMTHGYPVDPDGEGADAGGCDPSTEGACLTARDGGSPVFEFDGTFASDQGLYSAYYIAEFFDLTTCGPD